jgi:hypothetical protein
VPITDIALVIRNMKEAANRGGLYRNQKAANE